MPDNRLNFSIELSGQGKRRKTIVDPSKRSILNFIELKKRINNMDWEDYQKEAFIKYASSYPEGSLDYLWKNINHCLQVALKKFGQPGQIQLKSDKITPEKSSTPLPSPPLVRPKFNLDEIDN